MNTVNWDDLVERAQGAASRSYAPYSKIAVGAAVQVRSGEIYVGANVENASFRLSVCAEQTAILDAVMANGAHDRDHLLEFVVAVDSGGQILSPCGACRQMILEFGPTAEIYLTSGAQAIQETLVDPFDKAGLRLSQNPSVDTPVSPPSSPARALLRVLMMPDDDKILVMRLQKSLRDEAASLYDDISLDHTRSVLFVREGQYLVIAPGFWSNFDNPQERTIRIPLWHGITGAAYSTHSPNFGLPCSEGALHAQTLPATEQPKVDPGLKWVVAWPLGQIGAVSLDGFDKIEKPQMEALSKSPALRQLVDTMAGVLNG